MAETLVKEARRKHPVKAALAAWRRESGAWRDGSGVKVSSGGWRKSNAA